MDTLAFPGKVFISVKTNPEEAKWCLRYILIYSLIFVGLRWKNGLLIRKKDGEYYYLSWWTLYSSMSPLSVKVKSIHSYERGKVRDLNYLGIQITLGIGYRTVKGPWCVHLVEELDFVDPGKRVTKRLAHYSPLYYLLVSMPHCKRDCPAPGIGKRWKTFIKSISRSSSPKE